MSRPIRAAATLTAAALAATGFLAIGGTTTASAAPGYIVLDGQRVNNPVGCHNGAFPPLTLDNHTTSIVLLYEKPDCRGRVIRGVNPGTSTTDIYAFSVYVLS
ncbi:hypothetical protein [Nonomuraea jiangxiensis]|uniref:Secreted protein n=1 Tax=Nonomuraea jiangxiensis TaxID=633440 RepID=A0A1G9AU99_9ACTN|nr:hypothetical protein [Nonomuraea jiangxiensis]SDK30906.1 hypothetical protein SAMN05421869_11556 [Nonomuraea jiangxiensis]